MSERARLTRPPLVEVVCGVSFDQLGLTEGQMADFRGALGSGYPKLSFQQPLRDEFATLIFRLGVPLYEQRWWMETEDGEWLVQLQQDRLLCNWRLPPGGDYPQFEGVLARFLGHWETLRGFVQQRLGRAVVAKRVEVTKVNHIARGTHWERPEELCAVLPFLGALRGLVAEEPLIDLTLVDAPRPMSILSARTAQDNAGGLLLRLELTRRCELGEGEEVRAALLAQSEQLNERFYSLIPAAELGRFMDGGQR